MSIFSNLFSKKAKAIATDYSWLAVDIHSHLIPGIDDGVKTLEESIALIKELKSLGLNRIITSPHIMTDGYNNSSFDILRGRDLVLNAIAQENIQVSFDAIAEYYLDETIFQKIKDRDILTIGDNYVLVELSYYNKSHGINKYFFELRSAGYKVILAHPERYPYYHSEDLDSYQEIIDSGILLQLNLSSITGVYGKHVKQISEKLIDAGMIHFVGTDLHNLRHLSYIKDAMVNPYMEKVKALQLLNKAL
jgi:tyrosine-protein phosphatase YwqE